MMRTLTPYEEFQKRRFMRPDAHRWRRPDGNDRRFWSKPLAAEEKKAAPALDLSTADLALIEEARSEFARLRWMLADLRLHLMRRRYLERRAYNPNQPRVPAGNPDGGQWTDGEGGGSSTDDASVESESDTNDGSSQGNTEFSSANKARGHHFVPQAVHRNLPLRPETRKVFEEGATGRLYAERHGWSVSHDHYNKAVGSALERYMRDKSISPESMTPAQADDFLQSVKRSSDPRIRDFNLRILRKEIFYWIRRAPRGRE